jgi:hypothetical protein
VGLILGLSRNHLLPDGPPPTALAAQWLEEALAMRDRGVPLVGIDLHGDEQAYPDPSPFVGVFRTAAAAGLGRRAHAGEGAGVAGFLTAGTARSGHVPVCGRSRRCTLRSHRIPPPSRQPRRVPHWTPTGPS